jgi:hypothetical protein
MAAKIQYPNSNMPGYLDIPVIGHPDIKLTVHVKKIHFQTFLTDRQTDRQTDKPLKTVKLLKKREQKNIKTCNNISPNFTLFVQRYPVSVLAYQQSIYRKMNASSPIDN